MYKTVLFLVDMMCVLMAAHITIVEEVEAEEATEAAAMMTHHTTHHHPQRLRHIPPVSKQPLRHTENVERLAEMPMNCVKCANTAMTLLSGGVHKETNTVLLRVPAKTAH